MNILINFTHLVVKPFIENWSHVLHCHVLHFHVLHSTACIFS